MEEIALVLDLLSEILIDILSRLPVRNIISCKCVCKKWLNLISSPEFAKSHLSRSTPCLIVTTNGNMCRVFELEDVAELQHNDLHYKPMMKFNPNTLSSSPNLKMKILCSGSGLICLLDSSITNKIDLHDLDGINNNIDTLYICNPVTREYIPLPHIPMFTPGGSVVAKYGIAISKLTSQCKVVRISHVYQPLGGSDSLHTDYVEIECMVYTLGTNSWKSIKPNVVYEYDSSSFGVFLNGNMHWLVRDAKKSQQISCFDLETEVFRCISPPFPSALLVRESLIVPRNCLCFCDYVLGEKIDTWMMKEYGVHKSWTKAFVVRLQAYDNFGGHYPDRFRALNVFKDGDILMYKENGSLFYHSKKTETNSRAELFEPDNDRLLHDAMLHTPSFMSLRSLGSENVTSFPSGL